MHDMPSTYQGTHLSDVIGGSIVSIALRSCTNLLREGSLNGYHSVLEIGKPAPVNIDERSQRYDTTAVCALASLL
jgi:hypothetical protein